MSNPKIIINSTGIHAYLLRELVDEGKTFTPEQLRILLNARNTLNNIIRDHFETKKFVDTWSEHSRFKQVHSRFYKKPTKSNFNSTAESVLFILLILAYSLVLFVHIKHYFFSK